MKLFPYKLHRVARGRWIWVSQYHEVDTFGIPEVADTRIRNSGFFSMGEPGFGFFAHIGNSHTYRRFCSAYRSCYRATYMNLLFTKHPNYRKLADEAEAAMRATDDTFYQSMFESYRNMILLAERFNSLKRVCDSLRRKVHRHHGDHESSQSLKEAKRQLRRLEDQSRAIAFDLGRFYSEATMAAYDEFTMAFYEVTKVHHIWDITDENRSNTSRERVFFDLGALNYIHAPLHIPMMRSASGELYFILPDRVLRLRTPLDFDTVMMRDVTMRWGAIGDDVQSELRFPELKLAYRFSSERRIKDWVEKWEALKATL